MIQREVSGGVAGSSGAVSSSVLLLGAFQVQQAGEALARFRGTKVRALLAYLAVEADRPHTRSALAGLFWPDQPEEQALRNLSQALVRVRQAVGGKEDPLLITRQAVQWRPDRAWVDVTEFSRLAGSPDPADLEQAAALYRGEFLAGFSLPECEAFEEWLLLTRERLQHLALGVLHRLAEEYLATGQPGEAATAARRQLALDPWREAAHRQLMRSLALGGDRAAALAAYARCRQVLRDELDITPDDETRRLAEQIEAGELVSGTERPAPGIPSARPPSLPDLPTPLTSLVGRERDLALAAELLHKGERLLTLTGPGGVGKTRLALQIATEVRPHFTDGVAFIPLVSLADAGLVLSTIAQVLGMRQTGSQPLAELLQRALRGRCLLLVLDNCEHVLSGMAEVAALLEGCRELVVLATSRAPLRLRGEREYPVAPLAQPAFAHVETAAQAASSPAVRLFVERAEAARPGFVLSDENAAAVAAICKRLDGLPLALELAAPRVKLLPPATLLARLHQALPLLTGGGRDVPTRHQTLRSTIAWSYGLLEESERALFRRLSVFAGGWTLEGAETVCAVLEGGHVELLEGLGALADQSLLQVRELAGEPRFVMLETIREFAQDELEASGEETTIRAAHAQYMVALVEEIYPRLWGPEQVRWIARLAAEQDNVRAALRWLLDDEDLEAVGRLLRYLERFWWMQGQMAEARRWAEEVLTRDAPPLVRARACLVAGLGAVEQGNQAALALLREARALAQAGGDRLIEGQSLLLLAFLAPLQGDLAGGIAQMRQAQQLLREAGDEWGVVFCLGGLSTLYVLADQLDEAERYSQEHVTLAQRMGDLRSTAQAYDCLAVVALLRRDLDRVADLLTEAIVLAREVGQFELIMYGLMGLAAVAADRDPACAARLFGAAERLRETAGVAIWPTRRTLYDPALELVRDALGTDAFDAAWAEGRAMTREQAVAYAVGERGAVSRNSDYASNRSTEAPAPRPRSGPDRV